MPGGFETISEIDKNQQNIYEIPSKLKLRENETHVDRNIFFLYTLYIQLVIATNHKIKQNKAILNLISNSNGLVRITIKFH